MAIDVSGHTVIIEKRPSLLPPLAHQYFGLPCQYFWQVGYATGYTCI